MNEFDNNNTGTAPNDTRKYSLDKKMFSRVGFALLAVFCIGIGLEIAASVFFRKFFPNIYALKYFSTCCNLVCNYLIAIPIGVVILNTVIKPWALREDKKLGCGKLLMWFSAGVSVMLFGGQIGSMVNSLIERTSGNGSYSGIDSFISGKPLWLSFVIMVILAPIAEELLFRRGVTEALRPWGWKTAILLGGLFFGLFHGNLEQFFYAALFGMLLGYVYLYTGKLRYTIILHMAVNSVTGFLPLLINRFSFSSAELQRFIDASNAYSAAALSAAKPEDIPAELMREMLVALSAVLPGMALSMLYNAIVLGFAVAGIIVIFRFYRRLCFKNPERRIEGGCIGDTIFLAPGVLLFVLVMAAFMVLAATAA